MKLRPMEMADVDAVADLEAAISPGPWTRGIFRDCLLSGYEAWVLEAPAGILVTFGVLSVGANEAHVLNLGVAPAFRRQGHGRRMMRHLLERAAILGARMVFLEVRISNEAAQELYKGMGFREIGVRRNYYRQGAHGREDALVYSLSLPVSDLADALQA